MAWRVDPNSKASQVLRVLSEGPATTGEVAAELGWDPRITCSHLCELRTRGKVTSRPFEKPAGSRGAPVVRLWSLPEVR